MKHTNFWTDNSPAPSGSWHGAMPSRIDVAVVGGGYTGLSASLALANSGATVAVLEAETVGWGASGRNGGLFAPDFSPSMSVIEDRYGKMAAQEFWRWSVQACEYLEQLASDEKIDCDLRWTGQVFLAYRPSHLDGAKHYADYLSKEFGHTGLRVLEKSDLHSEIGTDTYHGGVLDDLGGGLDPARFAYGLADAATRRGVQVVEACRVLTIKRNGGGHRLRTSQGDLEAKEVLLATNGYTDNLVRRARRGIIPVGSTIIVTAPLSQDLKESVSPKGRVFYDSKRYLNYFRLTPDGRLMFGGRKSLSPDYDLQDTAQGLHERMLEVFPQLRGVETTHAWNGNVGFTLDKMPHVGRLDGVYYAYGYSGHGLAAACYLGQEVGQLMAGERDHSPFMTIKHPRYFFVPWEKAYLPVVSAYFRHLDGRE